MREQQFYDFEEFERLVGEAGRRSPLLLAIVVLAGEAGRRSGEMQAMEWQDVNLSSAPCSVFSVLCGGDTCQHPNGGACDTSRSPRVCVPPSRRFSKRRAAAC